MAGKNKGNNHRWYSIPRNFEELILKLRNLVATLKKYSNYSSVFSQIKSFSQLNLSEENIREILADKNPLKVLSDLEKILTTLILVQDKIYKEERQAKNEDHLKIQEEEFYRIRDQIVKDIARLKKELAEAFFELMGNTRNLELKAQQMLQEFRRLGQEISLGVTEISKSYRVAVGDINEEFDLSLPVDELVENDQGIIQSGVKDLSGHVLDLDEQGLADLEKEGAVETLVEEHVGKVGKKRSELFENALEKEEQRLRGLKLEESDIQGRISGARAKFKVLKSGDEEKIRKVFNATVEQAKLQKKILSKEMLELIKQERKLTEKIEKQERKVLSMTSSPVSSLGHDNPDPDPELSSHRMV